MTLAELRRLKSAAEWRQRILGDLAGAGFPVTSWLAGSVVRTLIEVYSAALVDIQRATVAIANAGVLSDVSNDWLTVIARNFYNIERLPATFVEGVVTVTAGVGVGPYTLEEFIVGIQGDGDADAVRYRATETKTLNPGQTIRLAVKAESPGARYNRANGAINFAFTPLPGVTVSNPPGSNGTWQTRTGNEEEPDSRLRARCVARWATLSASWTDAAVIFHTLSATNLDSTPAGASRARIVYGSGQGDYRVVISSDSGPVSSDIVAAVQSYLDARKPITDRPAVESAVAANVAVAGTVKVKVGQNTSSNRAKVSAALATLQASQGIGEMLDLGAIYATIRGALPGVVVDVDITTPSGDVVIAANEVVALDVSNITGSGQWSS